MAYMASSKLPSIIDDDLHRVATDILNNALDHDNDDDTEEDYDIGGEQHTTRGRIPAAARDKLQQSVSAALQAERSGWKEKLHGTLQEVERQRRAVVALEDSLQQLAATCGIPRQQASPSGSGSDSGGSAADLVTQLQRHVVGLQEAEAARHSTLATKVKTLEASIAQMGREKCDQVSQLQEKTKEIVSLQTELNSIKHQLHKLSRVILSHNESNSSKFPLDAVRPPDDKDCPTRVPAREETYAEGDQLLDDVTSGNQVGVRRLRWRQRALDVRKAAEKRAITQCLRCQQLFKPKENNSMACRYHKKGREVKEQYDVTGRLCKVLYKWGCCKQGLHIQGCTYGYHV